MEIPKFSEWRKFSEWEQTVKRTRKGVYKDNGFHDYTPWNGLWGYREYEEGFCVNKDLVDMLSLHKIEKDGLNKPILLSGLWSNDKKFFLRFRGVMETNDFSYFLLEVSFKEWIRIMEWFYLRIWKIKKLEIKRGMKGYIDIVTV